MLGSQVRPMKTDANGRETICEFSFIAEKLFYSLINHPFVMATNKKG